MKNDELEKLLSSSVTGERIRRLLDVYSSLDAKEEKFCFDFMLHCPYSCGECCCHYVPFLSESEAETCAYLLIKEDRDEEILDCLSSSDPLSSVCPLYNADKSEHCGFYPGRSLVCRLFGSSVSLDKNGAPSFRDCRWKKEKRTITKEELEKKIGEVPVMSIYGEAVEEEEGEGESIYTALPKAIDKIRLLLSYQDSF